MSFNPNCLKPEMQVNQTYERKARFTMQKLQQMFSIDYWSYIQQKDQKTLVHFSW